jgi:hypothetical protein
MASEQEVAQQSEGNAGSHKSRVAANERGLKRIKFLVGQPPYCAGETAGFPPEVADRILAASINTPEGRKRVAVLADAPVVLKRKVDDDKA